MLTKPAPLPSYAARRWVVLAMLGLIGLSLIWRVVDLQVSSKSFLQTQGNARHLRVVETAAHRGMITDRNGEPLAISTPVDSVWANPQQLLNARTQWPALARLLNLDVKQLEQHLGARVKREFVYLKRRINPDLAQQVLALGIPGVSLQREYRRYYPAGEVTAHVLGFTGMDDTGQEGLELGYDDWLRGIPGAKRVLKDRLGHIVEDVENLRAPRAGRDLRLSLDRRIQYLAYRELKAAVLEHQAQAGSAVILDVRSGEVLAMVNLPAYNPNKPNGGRNEGYRNRAVTDLFEPGSTVKPLTVAAGLETGQYRPDTAIDTRPGLLKVGRKLIRDLHDYGNIDVSTVIQKSSNVGSTKIALSIPPASLWQVFAGVGFGTATGSGFPGEASGLLPPYQRWREIERATLSFGYGLSVTPLQLAQAYTVLAGDGRLRPVSFLPVATPPPGKPVIQASTAAQVRLMLEKAVGEGGTGTLARVPGYRVAGKTGTVHKLGANGYENRYLSVFAALAPVSQPRLAMVVVVNDPSRGDYYGGLVAAPVFSKVMTGALRLLNVAPDNVEPTLLAQSDVPLNSTQVVTHHLADAPLAVKSASPIAALKAVPAAHLPTNLRDYLPVQQTPGDRQ